MSPKSGAEAELKLQYPDEETARVVAEAVSPDNYQAPEGLELKIDRMNNEITVNVRCPKGVGSLITTLDDLLCCIGAAEKVLDGLK